MLWISRLNPMTLVPLHSDDPGGPSVFGNNIVWFVCNIIRPESQLYLDHFLALLGFE